LPPSWRNFATTLKHKRHEISVESLIASLDVEDKARAKDNTEKGEGQWPTWCRRGSVTWLGVFSKGYDMGSVHP
jgi:hypothetical protein